MSNQTVSVSIGTGNKQAFRADVPAIHVGDHFAVHRRYDGNPKTQKLRIRSGWVVAHRKTGWACCGASYGLSKKIAMQTAKNFMQIPMDWDSDDRVVIQERSRLHMGAIRKIIAGEKATTP